jgi:hypothetical protein
VGRPTIGPGVFASMGHDVRLITPHFVKAYVKSPKMGFKLFFCSGFLLFVVCHYASIQEYAL